MKFESLRMLMAVAAQQKMKVAKVDITTFYLYGKNKRPTYIMTLPKGLEEEDPEQYVYEVIGNIYGNPEAGQIANKDLVGKLIKLGFTQLKSDDSIFIKVKIGRAHV